MKKSKVICLFVIFGLLLISLTDISAQRKRKKPRTIGANASINETTQPLQCNSKDDGKTQPTYLIGSGKLSKEDKKRLQNAGVLAIPKGETERAKEIRKNAVASRKRQIEILEKSFEVWLKAHPDATPQELERRKRDQQEALEYYSDSRIKQLAAQKKWDWRDKLNVGPVLHQGDVCNTCWAFAATNAAQTSLQKSYIDYRSISYRPVENGELLILPGGVEFIAGNPSPFVQDLLNCMPLKADEMCNKGWHGTAFNFMVYEMGIPIAFEDGFTIPDANTGKSITFRRIYQPGQKFSCQPNYGFIQAVSWDYVGSPSADGKNIVATVEELKIALVEHGPLVAPIHSDNCFERYKGGVFNEKNMKEINHAVLLIGWDDEKRAWLVKNSWGEEWGEKGFAWIRYGSNNIGDFAAWIKAFKSFE